MNTHRACEAGGSIKPRAQRGFASEALGIDASNEPAREAGDSGLAHLALSPVSRANPHQSPLILGLRSQSLASPQALCCRLLRRLNPIGETGIGAIQILLILFCALTLCDTAIAQTGSSPPRFNSAVSEIKTYTAEIDKFIKANPKPRIFGDVSTTEQSRWREVKAKAAEDLYDTAEVWTREGKVVAASFALSSGSGDWVHFITYYFRADGTIAKIQAQLNTFYGKVSVVRDRYYDSHRKLIRSTRRILDLHTQKPVKKADFMDNPIPMYNKVSALPFHRFL